MNNKTFTLKGKINDYELMRASKRSPGPASYNTGLSMSGRMTLSKFRYRGGAIITPLSNRSNHNHNNNKNDEPGPGHYK